LSTWARWNATRCFASPGASCHSWMQTLRRTGAWRSSRRRDGCLLLANASPRFHRHPIGSTLPAGPCRMSL